MLLHKFSLASPADCCCSLPISSIVSLLFFYLFFSSAWCWCCTWFMALLLHSTYCCCFTCWRKASGSQAAISASCRFFTQRLALIEVRNALVVRWCWCGCGRHADWLTGSSSTRQLGCPTCQAKSCMLRLRLRWSCSSTAPKVVCLDLWRCQQQCNIRGLAGAYT